MSPGAGFVSSPAATAAAAAAPAGSDPGMLPARAVVERVCQGDIIVIKDKRGQAMTNAGGVRILYTYL